MADRDGHLHEVLGGYAKFLARIWAHEPLIDVWAMCWSLIGAPN